MKHKLLILIESLALFFFITVVASTKVNAAGFSLDPTNSTLNVNDQITVNIGLNAGDKHIDQIQGVLTFSADTLQFVAPVNFSNIFPANSQKVSGNVIILSSGEKTGYDFFTGNQNWVTLTFKAIADGQGTLQFSPSDSLIYEVGSSLSILDVSSLPSGSYTINSPGVATDTPTPTPTSSGSSDGGSSSGGSSSYSCNSSQPETPLNLRAATGLARGEVALVWDKSSQADHYGVAFGDKSGQYQYGATNIGNINQYIVKSLNPGQLYYFVVFAGNGCASSGFTNEASARAKGGTGSGSIKGAPTPTPVSFPPPNFKPIGQVLPGSDVDLSLLTPAPTEMPIPTTVPEQNNGKLIPDYLLFGIIGALIVLAFAIVTYLVSREHKPPRIGNSSGTMRSDDFGN
jgi:hypothetical protein